MSYSELISRNFIFIDEDLQNKIKTTKLLFIGCGLGSQIATLAARTGFSIFYLFDGDNVELSNINRQAFDNSDIGVNKAISTAEKIKKINKNAKIEYGERYLTEDKEVRKYIEKSDVILNLADPDKAFYKINKYSLECKKLVLFPLNLGYTSYLIAFNNTSANLSELTQEKIDNTAYMDLLSKTVDVLPEDLTNLINSKKYEEMIKGMIPAPQLGITSYVTSAMVINYVLLWLKGSDELPLAPKSIIFNLNDIVVAK